MCFTPFDILFLSPIFQILFNAACRRDKKLFDNTTIPEHRID